MIDSSSFRYRHITFADAMDFSRRPVDLAPQTHLSCGNDGAETATATALLPHPSRRNVPIHAEERSLLRWLLARARLDLDDYRIETFSRRLPACLRLLRASSAAQARMLIERNPSLLPAVISTLVIGVTSFFRDAQVFQAIESNVIPRLLERLKRLDCRSGAVAAVRERAGDGVESPALRIWSAGCADGAELYSVAMLLAERGVAHRCHLLGTDCRLEATRRASVGWFPAACAERDIAPPLLARYFEPDDENHYVARPSLRSLMQWRTADVLHLQEPGPWDLILCRNLAIYLRCESAARLWRMLESLLRPGGYLVLGKAERPNGATSLCAVAPCIYRRERG